LGALAGKASLYERSHSRNSTTSPCFPRRPNFFTAVFRASRPPGTGGARRHVDRRRDRLHEENFFPAHRLGRFGIFEHGRAHRDYFFHVMPAG
jgi:hypothetical protein